MAFVQNLFSQYTNLELNNPLSGDITVSATQSITLKPGFLSAGYSFNAKTSVVAFPEYQKVTPSSDKNYIHTVIPLSAITKSDLEDIIDGTTTKTYYANEFSDNVQYFDGLGRPDQEVGVRQSPTYNDIVSFHTYDNVGREYRQNPVGPFGNGSGQYTDKDVIESNLELFFDPVNTQNTGIPKTLDPYGFTKYDESPLNRVTKQGASGTDWQTDLDYTDRQSGEHVVSYNYTANTAADNIYIIEVTSTNKLEKKGAYATNKLFCSTVYDENNQPTREFKSFEGQVILKETYDGSNWLKTYYAYDDFGLLRFVIPPKAFTNLSALAYNSAMGTETNWIAGLCYNYEYDEKKRMVKKKLPGAGTVSMFYDNRNRLVLTQDGILDGLNKYIFTKYDAFNRPCVSGTVYIQGTESYIIAAFNNYTQSQVTHTSTTDYAVTFPTITGGTWYTAVVLTKTYYDNYSYPGKLAYGGTGSYEATVTGQITGAITKVGETGTLWTVETPYYDEYGRVHWSKKTVDFDTSHEGTEEIATTYNFSGQPIEINQKQVLNSQTTQVSTYMAYDHMGRLISEEQQVVGETVRTPVSTLYYNDLGQLSKKILGNNLQRVDYSYNMRGWLTNINDPYDVVNDNNGKDLFAMELLYNDYISSVNSSVDKQYNGNITAIQWTSKNSSQAMERQAYGFTYDGINRIKAANYAKGVMVSANDGFYNSLTASNNYKVSGINYDKNGNITSLRRNDPTGTIDNIIYTYNTYSNQLKKTLEVGNLSYGFKSNTNAMNATTQYTYNANGNMLTDMNKSITDVDYNHLNLPTKVTLSSNNVQYIYGASGTKYKKTTSDGNGTKYYFSNFEYDKNMVLDYIHTRVGRIRVKSSYAYDYYLKDHLSNTRVVFSVDGTLQQVSNYYPFGMRFSNSNEISNQTTEYLYNGKEFQMELGWYDYGFRMYDATLGRFPSLDPLADKFHWVSPYNYAENSPIAFIDLWGLQKYYYLKWFNNQNNSNQIDYFYTKYTEFNNTTKKHEEIQGESYLIFEDTFFKRNIYTFDSKTEFDNYDPNSFWDELFTWPDDVGVTAFDEFSKEVYGIGPFEATHNVLSTERKLEIMKRTTYEVINGSYPDKKSAQRGLSKYKNKYPSAKIIEEDGNFRVSLGSFSELGRAIENRNTYREVEGNNEIWIFIYYNDGGTNEN